MAWENWPQTNVHELNLDWMLNKIKELSAQLETNLKPVYDAIAKGDSNTLASAKIMLIVLVMMLRHMQIVALITLIIY